LILDQQRIALAVARLAGGGTNPPLADAVFLDVAAFDSPEANSNARASAASS
jgi:hypothetical protein